MEYVYQVIAEVFTIAKDLAVRVAGLAIFQALLTRYQSVPADTGLNMSPDTRKKPQYQFDTNGHRKIKH